MKRAVLLRHLRKEGCSLLREGAHHTLFLNVVTKRISTVPRHTDIHHVLARKICRDLGIAEIKKNNTSKGFAS